VAAPFVVTSPTNTVLLGPDRVGQAAFTISNQTGRSVRARAFATALDPTNVDWLAVVGMAERAYPIGGAEQVTVTVTVPPDVMEGVYPFRLDVASVTNPDAEWAHGPVVAFQVPKLPPPPPPPPVEPLGYLETVLGAFAGALPLGGIGVGIGLLLLAAAAGGSGDFWQNVAEAIARVFIAVFLAAFLGILGLWIGAAVGAGVTLRARGFRRPWLTAVPLAVLFPVWAILIFAIVLSAVSAIDNVPGAVVIMAILFAALLAVTVPALGGRAFARWRLTGGL
jgi:hypothetical protein